MKDKDKKSATQKAKEEKKPKRPWEAGGKDDPDMRKPGEESKRSLEEGLKDHFKERLNEALLGNKVSRQTLSRMGRVRGGKVPGGRVRGELYGASGTDPYGNARRREGRGFKGSGRGMASMLSAEFGIPRIV